MSESYSNPFPSDPDRREIWEMLMRRDFEAFIHTDWNKVASDFIEEEFQGIDGGKVPNPDDWRIKYADIASYRDEWLRQAEEFKGVEFQDVGKLDFFFQSCTLSDIDIRGERAMAHKKFDGRATTTTGEVVRLLWQTLYLVKKSEDRWRITGFVGYLPNPLP